MRKKVKSSAEYYFPHDFETSVTILDNVILPEIIITEKAYMDMIYITSQADSDEISWLGSVDKADNIYTINNVYLFDQVVSSASTEITEKSIVKLGTEMLKAGSIKEVNKLRFWGHLHPGGSTSPSHTDNQQLGVFQKRCNDYFIRGIFGRKGRAEFTLFDFENGLCFNDIEWKFGMVSNTERRDYIKKCIGEKVKKETTFSFPMVSSWEGNKQNSKGDNDYFKFGHYFH